MAAGHLDLPLSPGHTQLHAAGGALEDLILFALLHLRPPAAAVVPPAEQAQKALVLHAPPLHIHGQGPHHAEGRRQQADIPQQIRQDTNGHPPVPDPADHRRDQQRDVQLVDAIFSRIVTSPLMLKILNYAKKKYANRIPYIKILNSRRLSMDFAEC